MRHRYSLSSLPLLLICVCPLVLSGADNVSDDSLKMLNWINQQRNDLSARVEVLNQMQHRVLEVSCAAKKIPLERCVVDLGTGSISQQKDVAQPQAPPAPPKQTGPTPPKP